MVIVQELPQEIEAVEVPVKLGGTPSKNYKGIVSKSGVEYSVVSKNYQLLDNNAFIDIAKAFAKTVGMPIEHYIFNRQGQRVYAYIKTEGFKISGFELANSIVLANSHDANSAFWIGSSNILKRCNNQFGTILRQSGNNTALKIRHSKNSDFSIATLQKWAEDFFAANDAYYAKIEKLSAFTVDKTLIEGFVKYLLNIDIQASPKDISTLKKNKMSELRASIKKETAELGMTAFGVWNGMTHYTTFKVKQKHNTIGSLEGQKALINEKGLKYLQEISI